MSNTLKVGRFQTALITSLLAPLLSLPSSEAQEKPKTKQTVSRSPSKAVRFTARYSSGFDYTFAINPTVEKEIKERFLAIDPGMDIAAISIHQRILKGAVRYNMVQARLRDGGCIDVELGEWNGLFPNEKEVSLRNPDGYDAWRVYTYYGAKWEGYDGRQGWDNDRLPSNSPLIHTGQQLARAAAEILSQRKNVLSIGRDIKASDNPPAQGLDNSTYTNSGEINSGLGIERNTQQKIIALLNGMNLGSKVASISLVESKIGADTLQFILDAKLSNGTQVGGNFGNPAADQNEITFYYTPYDAVSARYPDKDHPTGSIYRNRELQKLSPQDLSWEANVARRSIALSNILAARSSQSLRAALP